MTDGEEGRERWTWSTLLRGGRKALLLLAFPVATMNVACSLEGAAVPKRDELTQMQASPELKDPAYFAGTWMITGSGPTCRVTLAADRIESANAHVLTESGGCLTRIVGRPVAGGRPATDGLDIAGPDRLSVGFFSFTGDKAVLDRPEGALTLSREGGGAAR